MPRTQKTKEQKSSNGASLPFRDTLWEAADKLRGHIDPAEYKHVVLGLVFLKYISDAFEDRYRVLAEEEDADLEDPDEYLADNVFWVPPTARWSFLRDRARQPEIGQLVDNAMSEIEKANEKTLKGVLRKDYGRSTLDKQRLGELIDLVSKVGLGDEASRSQDILGRVYEYFLGRFASAEGKGGGEFYTPQSVVKLLVAMLEPYRGRIYDPCCGSGGMFVQSEKFVEAHGGRVGDLSIYGQESNPTTWQLCKMNLAIRGIEANLGPHNGDTFHDDLHPDLRADFILANPPFNVSDWRGDLLRDDGRWRYGAPPVNNANFAWVQHIVYHLAPSGVAGFVLANGSMSANTSGEGDIRRAIIEADLVDCMVALPPQLFFTTQIPACLWFLSRNKAGGRFRDRRGQTLFIDARKRGYLVDRTHRELSDEELEEIARIYHAWRGEAGIGEYADVAGFCKSATREEIAEQGYVLTPGRYVGVEETEDDEEGFEEKMLGLVAILGQQLQESALLGDTINENLKKLGYDL